MSALLKLLQQKKQDLAAGRKGKTVKPAPGRSLWRIFPSWRKDAKGNPDLEGQFWHDFGQHFIKDASNNILAIYVDTEKTFGRPSELNQVLASAIKTCTDDATMNLLKEARASGSVLLNAMQIDGDKPTEVQILEIRPSVFEQIVGIATEYEAEGVSIFDINAGKEIIIERTGQGLKTKYSVQVAAKNRGVVPADVLKNLHDLDVYVQQETADGAFRALNAVKTIAGLLPAAPSGAAGIPTTRAAAALPAAGAAKVEEEEDIYAAAPAPARKATPAPAPAAAAEQEDVPELRSAPAEAVSTGNSELDDLLAGLEN